MRSQPTQTLSTPFPMVGSNSFGRYPKISVEQTFNMIMSDEFLVPYAGYKNVNNITSDGVGRSIFYSSRANSLFAVVGQNFYILPAPNVAILKGALQTNAGDVFIDENDNSQIAICDKKNIYIYNYNLDTFGIAASTVAPELPFVPGYISFQDGYFISAALDKNQWYLSNPNNGLLWDPLSFGTFQTKPDQVQACIRVPGKGNLLLVMGKVVTEAWYDAGSYPFPYQRSSSFNIDYGCLNSSTIAFGDKFVVWLGANEKSGPVIMYSEGGEAVRISNDGIDFKLSTLVNPQNAYGFLFKQDGHIIYQITFPDPEDNITYAFDFTTKRFFSLCDENQDAHIAKRVSFFDDSYYFVSFDDGNLYELSTAYTNYDYGTEIFSIPRIRITPTFRLSNGSPFIGNKLSFPIEQGVNAEEGRIDYSISVNGGQSFGTQASIALNTLGNYRNSVNIWGLGYTNELTMQLRFEGFGRFVIGNGSMEYYQ